MKKDDYKLLQNYFTVTEDFYKALAKMEEIEVFVNYLKIWVFHKCSISLYPVGRLSFSFGDKTEFVIVLPYEVAKVLKGYLDPEEKKNEKDVQKKN